MHELIKIAILEEDRALMDVPVREIILLLGK